MAVAVEGANRHDMKLVKSTLDGVMAKRPQQETQNLCLDKGYDFDQVRALVAEYGYTAHIRSRGEEHSDKQSLPSYRARRWVVERSHSWLNRFRRILIRWEKNVDNYIAMLHFACAWITFRATMVSG